PQRAAAGRARHGLGRRPPLRRAARARGGCGRRRRALPRGTRGPEPGALRRRHQRAARRPARAPARGCGDRPRGARGGRGSAERLAGAGRVLDIETRALVDLGRRLDERFARALDLLLACRGKVIVTGVGKSGIVARKIAATLTSTGTPAVFLHAGEAGLGDLGTVGRGAELVTVSYS